MKNNYRARPLLVSAVCGALCAFGLMATNVHAAGEVSELITTDTPATPSRYTIDGKTYTWGMGRNQVMDGFMAGGVRYEFATEADRIEILRHDVSGVSTGNPCGVFVERHGVSAEVLQADYPSDGSNTGNCDMAAMLASRVVNRGALDLFSNSGDHPKNVERVDYIFDTGLLSPLNTDALTMSGHVVAEKSGNNPLQIAAITSLDIFGQPSGYGPLVYVDRNGCADPTVCYGVTNVRHNYAFFQNNSNTPQGFPSFLRTSTESIGMAYVSLDKLGLSSGQVYYGFSYFPFDVDASVHNLLDVASFPNDTNDEKIVFGDGPDIYGGVSGYFLADSLSVASGAVFKDENADGQKGDDEAGISDIRLTLFIDSNGNGVFDEGIDQQVGPSINTDINGEFKIPGLDDGIYFLLLDESDADIPPGISVAPGTNPAVIVIAGQDAEDVNFSFVSDSGLGDSGGSDAGNDGKGSADSGASDTGGTDSGASDSGTNDSGTNDSGSVDSGVADSGMADSGAADSGASDNGSVDSGTSDNGVTDSGEVDSGISDSGAIDSGASDTGGTDSGASDSGGTDSGASDTAGSTDFVPINDGVNATKANADSATVNQGSSVSIDVLANDDDAPGEGLTLVSNSDSPNAIIEIVNGEIVYTPDYGYTGTDSFLYVMQDAAGTQSTGTVTVDVLRYSDINNNALNDFDECNCENLTIEVGVEGTALAASSLFSLLSLALFVLFGRRIRKTAKGGELQ